MGVVASYAVSRVAPVLSALTVAVVLGALARNIGLTGRRVLPGITIATKRLLRAGVVLLGLQLSVSQVLDLPYGVLLVVVVTVGATFAGTLLLGRWLGVRPGTALLVATGFSICGASAAAAMNAASDSDEEDLATAVGLVTMYGGLMIVVLPLLQSPLGLSAEQFGIWSGASVHEVAQVVAAASAAGTAAIAVATVVKLTRVLLLVPMITAYGLVQRRRSDAGDQGKRPPLVPLFVLGFVAAVAVRSTGLLPGGVLDTAKTLTTLLLAGALFGLGSAVDVRSLVRTGGRALALGAGSTVIALMVSLLGIWAVT
ncbi:putative sulfate exporter family transporter [Luedemannella helvata]|uniref:Sulfate exporter family transporter n=1 Tax=Luedemannella helvata TaxID=349315 RepID=A0ABN2JVC0_9ACTN